MKNSFNSSLVYCLFLAIETELMLHYPLSLEYGFFGIYNKGKSMEISELINSDSILYVFIIAISLTLIYVGSFIIYLIDLFFFEKNITNPKDSFRYCSRFYGLFLQIFQYILAMPLLEALFFCIPGGESKWKNLDSNMSAAITAACSVCFVFGIILDIVIIFFYHDEQIDSKLPWAMSPLYVEYMKLLKKIMVAFASDFHFTHSIESYFLVAILVISTGQYYLFITAQQMDKKWPQIVTIMLETSQWVVYVTCFINELAETVICDIITIWIILVPTLIVVVMNLKWRRRMWLLNRSTAELLDINLLEEYVRNLVLFVDSNEKYTDYSTLVGYMKQHTVHCESKDCACKFFRFKEGASEITSLDDNVIEANKVSCCIYQMCRYFIQDGCSKTVRNSKIYLLSAYVQFILQGNKFQALYDLQQATEIIPSFYEEFLMFRLQYFYIITHFIKKLSN